MRRLLAILLLSSGSTIPVWPQNPGEVSAENTHKLTGDEAFNQVNAVVYADQQSGSTADAQIRAALAKLPTYGGIIDARGYGATTQTWAANVTLGAASGTSPKVQLLVDSSTVFNVTVTGGVDALDICGGSMLEGWGNGQGSQGGFVLAATANVSALVSNCNRTGNQEFFALSNVMLTGNPSATVSQAMLDLDDVAVNSYVRDVVIFQFPSIGLQIRGTVGSNGSGSGVIHIDNVWSNGFNVAGAIPLSIQGLPAAAISDLHFMGGAYENPGSGKSAIQINGNGTQGGVRNVLFQDVHVEGAGTSGTAQVMIRDVQSVTFQNGFISARSSSGVTGVSISQSASGNTYGIKLDNVFIYNSSTGAPLATAISNSISGYSSTKVYIPHYRFGDNSTVGYDDQYPIQVTLGGHLNQVATGTFAGSCSMSSTTTCTFSIASSFAKTPLATCSIDAASKVPGTAISCKVSVSGTTVTITAGASNSLTWDAVLIGNPN